MTVFVSVMLHTITVSCNYSVHSLGHGRGPAGAGTVCEHDSVAIWWQHWTPADC